MRRVFCAALFIAFSPVPVWSQTPVAIPADDNTVVPGQRVGPITLYSSLSVLQALYGTSNVRPKMQPLPSGDTTPGARLFEGTDRELDIVWDEEGRDKRAVEVRITGKAWTFPNGLRTGLGVDEVTKINGKPFKLNSSDVDYASFDGGALASGQGIRFTHPAFPLHSAPPSHAVSPPHSTSPPHHGADKKAAAATIEVRGPAPVVTQIAIWLR